MNEIEFNEDFKSIPEINKDLDTIIHVTHFEPGNPYEITVAQRSEAIINLVSKLGFPFYFIKVIKIIPTFIRDYFYNIVGCNRYKWFGKIDNKKDDN